MSALGNYNFTHSDAQFSTEIIAAPWAEMSWSRPDATDEAPTPLENAERIEAIRGVWQALDRLGEVNPRRAKALKLRYGIGCQPHTFAAVGEELGVSIERARQICLRAERKLAVILRRFRPGQNTKSKAPKKALRLRDVRFPMPNPLGSRPIPFHLLERFPILCSLVSKFLIVNDRLVYVGRSLELSEAEHRLGWSELVEYMNISGTSSFDPWVSAFWDYFMAAAPREVAS